MALRSLPSSIALALASTLSLTAPTATQAQNLLDFLWGGGQEWGGSRQDISFDPKYTAGQIIVSFGDRRLYLITKAGHATSYPIAVPREQSRWQGTTIVSEKKVNPSWRPTPDMIKENPKLPTWVPGGHPMNPLGVRAMYLGASTYRIHGTDAPWTIGQAVSKGCIRMLNEDVLDLYPKVPVGMRVTVTWQRFNSDAVASGDEPAPYATPSSGTGFAGYKSPSGPRTFRNLPTPPSDDDTETVAAVHTEGAAPQPAIVGDKAAKPATKSAEHKATEPKPADTKKAETQKSPATPAVHDVAEAANRAAAAASKAAAAAREAAETAKKAAEDAKKAASEGTEPGRSAAL